MEVFIMYFVEVFFRLQLILCRRKVFAWDIPAALIIEQTHFAITFQNSFPPLILFPSNPSEASASAYLECRY